MEFSEASSSVPQPAHRIEGDQISIRRQIRELIRRLPTDEANEHVIVLDKTEVKLQAEKLRQDQLRFNWDTLPPEIQNMIFRFAMTTPEVIVPEVSDPCRERYRMWRQYNLSGQILRLNKTIYEQTLPILLGENTFHFNYQFHYVLGMGRKAPQKRGALVRRIVSNEHLRLRMSKDLEKLTNLEEITIISSSGLIPQEKHLEEKRGFQWFKNYVHEDLKLKVEDSPETTVHFVHKFYPLVSGALAQPCVQAKTDSSSAPPRRFGPIAGSSAMSQTPMTTRGP